MTIRQLYRELTGLADYLPSARVNFLFSNLVDQVVDRKSNKSSLSLPEQHKLNQICALAEGALESHWSREIISGKAKLADFPYHQNYKDLTRLEWHSIHSCVNHHTHEVLFVGGGPLPLTAIILALDFGLASTVIDCDEKAVNIAQKLIKKLKLEKLVKVVQADGANFTDYASFNTIFVAALAGLETRTKFGIFQQIKKLAPTNCHILARSSWGLRKLLYRPLARSVWKLLTPVLEIRPHNQIVNSAIVFRK